MIKNIQELRFIQRGWYTNREKIAMNIAWLLPRWLIYFAIIRAWANATTGQYGNTNPSDLTVYTMIRRWEDKNEG